MGPNAAAEMYGKADAIRPSTKETPMRPRTGRNKPTLRHTRPRDVFSANGAHLFQPDDRASITYGQNGRSAGSMGGTSRPPPDACPYPTARPSGHARRG